MRLDFERGWIIVRAAEYELLVRWWLPPYLISALALLRFAMRGDLLS